MSKGYRSPTLQTRRWQQQADAWVCPNGCGHHASSHREYQPKFKVDRDGELIEVPHPRYRPNLFACDECLCEFQANA